MIYRSLRLARAKEHAELEHSDSHLYLAIKTCHRPGDALKNTANVYELISVFCAGTAAADRVTAYRCGTRSYISNSVVLVTPTACVPYWSNTVQMLLQNVVVCLE